MKLATPTFILQVAVMARDPLWIYTLSYTPLLRYCDELASLLSEYFPEGVGISPTTVCLQRMKEMNDKRVNKSEDVTKQESVNSSKDLTLATDGKVDVLFIV